MMTNHRTVRSPYILLPRITWLLLFALFGSASKGEEIITLPQVRAMPTLAFITRFYKTTQRIIDIQITDVPAGSNEEKFGVKKGDFITIIDGRPVAGQKRSEFESDGKISLRGRVTIVRRSGLFRRNWKVTLEYTPL